MTQPTPIHSPRTLAIGDIHGTHIALDTLLALVDIRPHDTLVVLGDAINRGPGTQQVLDRLVALAAQCKLVFILGNHEEMLLDAVRGKRGANFDFNEMGGAATIASYQGSLANLPPAHLAFIESAVDYWESGAAIFVHANLEPGVPLRKQTPLWLRWTHINGTEPPFVHAQAPNLRTRVICGHSPQRNGLPTVFPGWVAIDTWAFNGGWLTCLDVESNQVYQANQLGETRMFPLAVASD